MLTPRSPVNGNLQLLVVCVPIQSPVCGQRLIMCVQLRITLLTDQSAEISQPLFMKLICEHLAAGVLFSTSFCQPPDDMPVNWEWMNQESQLMWSRPPISDFSGQALTVCCALYMVSRLLADSVCLLVAGT
jgi:hypothetical protein